MAPKNHCFLAASKAFKWINCTPSAVLEREFEDTTSEAAEEGSACHALCEYKVRKYLNPSEKLVRPKSKYDCDEMERCSDDYLSFVIEQIEEAKKHCSDPVVLVEQRLEFSNYVPEGFGTGDAVIIADDLLQVLDYKHGQGVLVESYKNPQMMLYALGALNQFDCLYDIKTVKMTIFQPRRQNISTYEMSVDELIHWAENELKEKAELAFKGQGDYDAGPWCQFCKAKVNCKARAKEKLELAKYEFKTPPLLSDDEIEDILQKLDDLISWSNDIKAYALDAAINRGKHWEGFKLVESRSIRKYSNEEEVAKICKTSGYPDCYKQSLKSITEMEKYMGKETFNELLGELVFKPKGKPTLVPISDKRQEIEINLKNEFKEI